MKYELWDLVQYGEGEELVPFTKLQESYNFYNLYQLFLKEINNKPCVILITKQENKEVKNIIYESPDRGKTIYKRNFGEKERIKYRSIK